jgi:hypothetical protein
VAQHRQEFVLGAALALGRWRSSISRVRRLLVAVSSVVRCDSFSAWRLSCSFLVASATNTCTLARRICGITGVNRKSAAPRW